MGVLETSEERSWGSRASNQPVAPRSVLGSTHRSVSTLGPGLGPGAPVLSLYAVLCGLGPVSVPLRASVSLSQVHDFICPGQDLTL